MYLSSLSTKFQYGFQVVLAAFCTVHFGSFRTYPPSSAHAGASREIHRPSQHPRRAQSDQRKMTTRLQKTCVVTMMLIADNNSSLCAFHLASNSVGTRQRQRIRARSASSLASTTPASTTAGKPDERNKGAVPPPTRRSRADIDVSSVDLALSNLAGALSPPPRQDRASPNQQQAHNTHDSAGSAGSLPSGESGSDVLTPVRQLISRGNVAEAVRVLTVTTERLATGNSTSAIVTAATSSTASLHAGFTAVLTACANRGMWYEARAIIVRHMPAVGIQPSVEAWVLAIHACAGAGGSEQAVFLLHEMRSR